MPNTPNTLLKSSIRHSSTADSSCLIALIENRAREIGVASISLQSFEIKITQFADNPTYIHSITTLLSWDPLEIILCKTIENSPLTSHIQHHFSDVSVQFIGRKFFDEIKGAEIYRKACVRIHEIDYESKYVSMAALAALYKYIEFSQSIFLVMDSLKVSFIHPESLLRVDLNTLRNLEVIQSLTGDMKHSLCALFPCRTQPGSRLIRANLIQPLRDLSTILGRQQAIQELLDNSALRSELSILISQFPNTEIIIGKLVSIPKDKSTLNMKSHILNIHSLKSTLSLAISLSDLLQRYSPKSVLLRTMIENLEDMRISGLLNDIQKVVNETVSINNKSNLPRTVSLFLVKPGCSGLLDAYRDSYKSVVEDIHKLATDYKLKLNDSTVKICFTETRGFHIQFNKSSLNSMNLLDDKVIQISHKGKKCIATTNVLSSFNEKTKKLAADIHKLSFQILEDLILQARSKIVSIYNISHTLATADILISFTQYACTYKAVQPVFTDKFAIKESRHPLNQAFSTDKLIPNDIEFQAGNHLQIVTGKNSAGKTTYLTQAGLIVLMAHTGSYVPAASACLPILSQVFSRLGESESIEHNASSFLSEMQEMAYILQYANSHSFVIIDEVGRGTSHEDGVAIAWSICESLAKLECYCLFATHYSQLQLLENSIENVSNVQLDGFCRKLGKCLSIKGYGLEIAECSSLPKRMIEDAYQLASCIEQKLNSVAILNWTEDLKTLLSHKEEFNLKVFLDTMIDSYLV